MKLSELFAKMRGSPQGNPPRVGNVEIAWSWLGSFVGVAVLGWLGQAWFAPHDLPLLIASFGASAVLVFGTVRSPFAQPRNLIGGHLLSAAVGVVCWKLLHDQPWLAGAIAVATAIAVMHATRTLHPPGGATALIAVIGSPQIHDLGFAFVVIPATVGPMILLVVGLLINNISASRRYPEVWF